MVPKDLNTVKRIPAHAFRCFAIILFLGIQVQEVHPQGIGDTLDINLDEMPDAARIDTLVKLADTYMGSDLGRALSYASALRQIALESGNDTALVDALNFQGKIYFFLGDMDTAKAVCGEAIRLSDRMGDLKRKAALTYLQGILISTSVDVREGLDLFLKSNGYFRSLLDSIGIANTENAIGVAYLDLAVYDSSMQHLLESVRIAERLGHDPVLGKAYLNLGLVYHNLEEFPDAKSSFLKSLSINRELNNLINVAKSYQNLGNILALEYELDSAWILYNKALEICLSVDFVEGAADAYTGLGEVAEKRGDFNRGYELYAKALEYYEMCDSQQGELISFKNMALSRVKSGQYEEALTVFDSTLRIARQLGLTQRELEILENIYFVYEKMKDYRHAYETYRERDILEDSIMDIEKRERVAELVLLFDKEKDNARILSLENQNLELEKSKISYLAGGSSLVMILIFLFAYYSQRARKNRIIAEQRIVQLEEEKKLLAARSIVEGQEEERKRIAKELHDGLGVLLSSAKLHFTSIRDKTPESLPVLEKAASLLEQASGDVRRISHNMMPGLLTKYGLFEAVEELFEQVDEMEGIHAEVSIQGEQKRLPENTEIMLYRIFQEMVNNTLKHAEARNIKLKIDILEDRLKFEYSDDGKGFDMEDKLRQKSIGLTGMQSRVKFLGGELGAATTPGNGVHYAFAITL